MTTTNFHILSQLIEATGCLTTTWTPVIEQLAMFMCNVDQAVLIRFVAEYFQHSYEVVWRQFKDVLKGILILHNDYIQLSATNTCMP